MSIIKSIDYEVTSIYLNETGEVSENHIAIILNIDLKAFEGNSLIMKLPKLYNISNEELLPICENTIEKNTPLAYSVSNLHFDFILGNRHSYIEDGFRLLIEYKYGNVGYNTEIFVYNNGVWKRNK